MGLKRRPEGLLPKSVHALGWHLASYQWRPKLNTAGPQKRPKTHELQLAQIKDKEEKGRVIDVGDSTAPEKKSTLSYYCPAKVLPLSLFSVLDT